MQTGQAGKKKTLGVTNFPDKVKKKNGVSLMLKTVRRGSRKVDASPVPLSVRLPVGGGCEPKKSKVRECSVDILRFCCRKGGGSLWQGLPLCCYDGRLSMMVKENYVNKYVVKKVMGSTIVLLGR